MHLDVVIFFSSSVYLCFHNSIQKHSTVTYHTALTTVSRGVDLSLETCQSVLARTLTCCTAEQQRERQGGRAGDGSRGKRKQVNRTQNSICSGLDSSFFSLERAALNPICASCQLCLRVPCGGRNKQQTAD